MPDVIFATVTDPLSLGTLFTCIDAGGASGSELEGTATARNATGGFLQGNSRTKVENINPRYLCHTGRTLPSAGDTKNGYFVDAVVPGSTNDGHQTVSIRAHKRTNGDYVDTVGGTA